MVKLKGVGLALHLSISYYVGVLLVTFSVSSLFSELAVSDSLRDS